MMSQEPYEHNGVYLPRHTQDGLFRYVFHGIMPGDFLRAVLTNNFMAAFAHADLENTRGMAAIVAYVYNELPGGSHGSKEIVDEWCEAGGMIGKFGNGYKLEAERLDPDGRIMNRRVVIRQVSREDVENMNPPTATEAGRHPITGDRADD